MMLTLKHYVIVVGLISFLLQVLAAWRQWELMLVPVSVFPPICWLIFLRYYSTHDDYMLCISIILQAFATIFFAPIARQLLSVALCCLSVSRFSLLIELVSKGYEVCFWRVAALMPLWVLLCAKCNENTLFFVVCAIDYCSLCLKYKTKWYSGVRVVVWTDILQLIEVFFLKRILLRGFAGQQFFNIFSIIGIHSYPRTLQWFHVWLQLSQQFSYFALIKWL